MAKDLLNKARIEINAIDKDMADLFVRRMKAVKTVAEYKKENNLPIYDEAREADVISRNSSLIEDENLREIYKRFLHDNMEISKAYQRQLFDNEGVIHVELFENGYDIHLGRGLIHKVGEIFNLNRRVLILTDSGVPKEYSEKVKVACHKATILTMPEGEGSKSIDGFSKVLSAMVDFGMTRTDCLVAVGGGVVGDLGGFAAASYMRGIDFYNIPTTLLSQVDSSIGGKTAINLGGVKNIVGAFYQPKGVVVDPDLLATLPERHVANGMAEVIKMAVSFDADLFQKIENGADILEIIEGALKIKKTVVESDEKESGVRRVLNLGHTLGHAIESTDGSLYHGECVAIGMMAVCSDEVKKRLVPLLKKWGLPTEYAGDINSALNKIALDKKSDGDEIYIIYVDEIGSYRIEKQKVRDFTLSCEERI